MQFVYLLLHSGRPYIRLNDGNHAAAFLITSHTRIRGVSIGPVYDNRQWKAWHSAKTQQVNKQKHGDELSPPTPSRLKGTQHHLGKLYKLVIIVYAQVFKLLLSTCCMQRDCCRFPPFHILSAMSFLLLTMMATITSYVFY